MCVSTAPQVTVDLTSLRDLAEGEFRFALVNADDDSLSQVTVVPLSNDVVDGVLVTTFPPLPGDGQQLVTVQAEWLSGTGGFEEIGFVVFDDESGSVDGVPPDSFAYSQAVRESASRRMLFSHAQGPTEQCLLGYSSGARLGLYVFAENLDLALPEDHLRVRSIGSSSWEIGWEDTPAIWPGLETTGDRGYDDAILHVVATTEESVCGFDPRNWTTGESGGSLDGKGHASLMQCTATLTEGDSFEVHLSRTFTVSDDRTAVRFSFGPLQFDVSDADGMNDAFEAALVDAQGRSLVHVFTSVRDAFFNISEDLPAQSGAATSFGDGQVTVDLSGVPAGTEATLVLRLVNNDGDTQSSVLLTQYEVLEGAGAEGADLRTAQRDGLSAHTRD